MLICERTKQLNGIHTVAGFEMSEDLAPVGESGLERLTCIKGASSSESIAASLNVLLCTDGAWTRGATSKEKKNQVREDLANFRPRLSVVSNGKVDNLC